jgi:uncharacterized protein (DUF362 family)
MKLAPADDRMVRETEEDLRRLEDAPPARQIRAIHLMGLEREQIVAVAYREDAIRARLAEIPVDEETRDAIRHAMRWVWKEEEMHTTFVRGVLLRRGGPVLRARALAQQAAGAVAGWSSSVLHHVRWRDAPVSRFWAHFFTFFGWLAGKVPRAVTRSLRHLTFREYCRFSAAAEATAAMCWHRVAALDTSGGARFYAKMGRDEDHHGEIFGLLLEALDEEGRLAPGWSAQRIRDALAAISDYYVPREQRPDAATQPLASGGDVHVVCDAPGCEHAPHAGDPERALADLLTRLDLAGLVAERARAVGKAPEALRVAIKPTFMRAYHTSDPTPTTSPRLVAALARALRAHGCADVAVLESSHIYDWFHANRDVASVARYAGFDDASYRVVDAESDLVPHRFGRGMTDEQVPATWRDADLRISFGKLSTHPVDRVYLGLAQMESLLPRSDENVFVERRSQRGPATMALLGDMPPHLALVDAYEGVADGIGGIIASERPTAPRRLYGGRDAISVDLAVFEHAGEDDPRACPHLDAAMHWFGDPRGRFVVRGCTRPLTGWRRAYHDELSATLGFLANPMYVLASGRGALFSPEMDTDAFPEKGAPSLALRAGRPLVRWLLRTRRPRSRG